MVKSFSRFIENIEKKVLIVMRGPSGSGKSTLAKRLAGNNGLILSTDDFFMTPDGEYKFDPKLLRTYHGLNQERAKTAMESTTSGCHYMEVLLFLFNTSICCYGWI